MAKTTQLIGAALLLAGLVLLATSLAGNQDIIDTMMGRLDSKDPTNTSPVQADASSGFRGCTVVEGACGTMTRITM